MGTVEWLADQAPEHFTAFVGVWERAPRSVKSQAFERKFVKKPSFGSGTQGPVLYNMLLQRREEGLGDADCVFLVRDVERDHALPGIVERVIRSAPWPFKIIAVLPNPEVEAWQILLARVDPVRLAEVRRALQFSPLDEPLRLNSTTDDSRDCKIVAREFGLPEWTYEDWREVPVERLRELRTRQQGRDTGFSRLLDDLTRHLINPLMPRGDRM